MIREDEERLVQDTPQETRPGATPRRRTAIAQSVVAIFMLGFGIVLVVVRYDYPAYLYDSWSVFRYMRVPEVLDNVGCGIWASLVFFITAFVGYNSGKNRSIISLYLALCLFCTLVSITVVGVTIPSMSISVQAKTDTSYACGTYDGELRWCDKKHSPSEDPYSYWFHDRPTEVECKEYLACKDEVQRVTKLQLPFQAMMLVCAVVEFICGILGASLTCTGLCKCEDCCSSQNNEQPQGVVIYGMNADGQVTNMGNLPNNIPYPPPMFVPGLPPGGHVTNQRINVA